MSTPLVIPSNRMLRDASWLFESDLADADDKAAAAWDRRRSIERSITRGELLDEVTMTFTSAQDDELMKALDRDDGYTLVALLDQAKQAIVKRRLAGGE